MVISDEENELVRRSQQGDHEAFESLIRSHQNMIHALTYRMTGSLTDAEDLAQESFIQAFEQLGSFRQDSKFSSWLYRIAMNLCLNWKRRDLRRLKAYDEWQHSAFADAGDSRHDLQTSERVQQALLKLDAKQRAAIVLTVYDGLNHGEAAKVLGCSETTISWRIFTARRKLKKWLQAE